MLNSYRPVSQAGGQQLSFCSHRLVEHHRIHQYACDPAPTTTTTTTTTKNIRQTKDLASSALVFCLRHSLPNVGGI